VAFEPRILVMPFRTYAVPKGMFAAAKYEATRSILRQQRRNEW
jgi:hypothetical protein